MGFNLKKLGMIFAIVLLMFPSIAFSEDLIPSRYINVAVFQVEKDVELDPIFVGRDDNLIKTMNEKKSTLLFILHSPRVVDNDVLNIQSSTFHLSDAQGIENAGFDCQLNFTNKSDEDSNFFALGGMCTLSIAYKNKVKTSHIILKRTTLSDVLPTTDVWTRVYYDKQSNVVFYVDVD